MSLADEIYMKHHVSELRDLDEYVVKLWKEGQDRACVRAGDFKAGKGLHEIKDLLDAPEWRSDPTLCYECSMPKDGKHKMGCSKLHINGYK